MQMCVADVFRLISLYQSIHAAHFCEQLDIFLLEVCRIAVYVCAFALHVYVDSLA